MKSMKCAVQCPRLKNGQMVLHIAVVANFVKYYLLQ